MSTLNLRTGPDDEEFLYRLQEAWGLESRSEAARKAIEYAATHIRSQKKSKLDILEETGYLGCYSDSSKKSIERRLKESLKRKYES